MYLVFSIHTRTLGQRYSDCAFQTVLGEIRIVLNKKNDSFTIVFQKKKTQNTDDSKFKKKKKRKGGGGGGGGGESQT